MTAQPERTIPFGRPDITDEDRAAVLEVLNGHILTHGPQCKAFEADFAIVKAWKGDTLGNLIFKDTARNFNPMMAMAGKITIAEVEELVEPGDLDPNFIHTPGIFVNLIFQGSNYEKRIEQRTVRIRE